MTVADARPTQEGIDGLVWGSTGTDSPRVVAGYPPVPFYRFEPDCSPGSVPIISGPVTLCALRSWVINKATRVPGHTCADYSLKVLLSIAPGAFSLTPRHAIVWRNEESYRTELAKHRAAVESEYRSLVTRLNANGWLGEPAPPLEVTTVVFDERKERQALPAVEGVEVRPGVLETDDTDVHLMPRDPFGVHDDSR